MTGQRKYWKSYAKSNLKGNWGIAIAAMLAVVAVILSEIFLLYSCFREIPYLHWY